MEDGDVDGSRRKQFMTLLLPFSPFWERFCCQVEERDAKHIGIRPDMTCSKRYYFSYKALSSMVNRKKKGKS
jgi:hypothetical protein